MNRKELVKLSASSLGSALECPACFWRDYNFPLRIHLPGVLNRMDKIEKDYYDRYRNKIPPILKSKLKEKLVDIKTVLKLRTGIKYFDKKLNAILSGKMDDCFIDSKNRLVVMDNKTASPDSEEFLHVYHMQLNVYAFLLQKNGFKTMDHGYLVFYTAEKGDPQKGVIFKVTVKKLKLHPQKALKVFRYAVSLVRRPRQPKSHKDCETCQWLRGLGE